MQNHSNTMRENGLAAAMAGDGKKEEGNWRMRRPAPQISSFRRELHPSILRRLDWVAVVYFE
jgi:hypothetical protein